MIAAKPYPILLPIADARQAAGLIDFAIGLRGGRSGRLALLGVKAIIPMPYKRGKIGFPFAPRDDFLRGRSNVKLLGANEVGVTGEGLPATPKIWALEPAL